MNKTTIALVTAVLVGATAIAAPVIARPDGGFGDCGYKMHRGGGHEHHFDRLAERLELTDEQRSTVQAIVDEAKPKMREIKDQMRENRRSLRELTSQPDATDEQIRALADAQGTQLTELIVLRTKMRADIAATLTPEQLERFQDMRSGHRHKHRHES